MTKVRNVFVLIALILALWTPAFAGDMHSDRPAPPPARPLTCPTPEPYNPIMPGDTIENDTYSEVVADAITSALQMVLSLF
jgi:hypothetical protein